jgi:hypothetical protein
VTLRTDLCLAYMFGLYVSQVVSLWLQ